MAPERVYVYLDKDNLYAYSSKGRPSEAKDVRRVSSEDEGFKLCQELNKGRKRKHHG